MGRCLVRLCGPGLLVLACLTNLAMSGCSRNLFADSDPTVNSRLRYWNNDSATETTANRKKDSAYSFGLPGGGGAQ